MVETEIFSRALFAAGRDYIQLLTRGYPRKPVLKLVGDRYLLDRRQRHILMRGFSLHRDSRRRRDRQIRDISREWIHVDAYNVILTVLNHLLGNPVFTSCDGLLRDVGENYGHIRQAENFQRAMDLVCAWLSRQNPAGVTAVFDSPVSHSAEHALRMESRLRKLRLAGNTELAHSADHVIKKCTAGIIATSDSVIIDSTTLPIVDIPRHCLQEAFNATFPDLGDQVESRMSSGRT